MDNQDTVRRLWAGKLDHRDAPWDGRKVLRNLIVEKKGLIYQNYASKTRWKDIHFDGCSFAPIMFVNAGFSNCLFSDCCMPGVGFWKSEITDCMFKHCDLREVAFGGTNGKLWRPNRFSGCTFESCDLRSSSHSLEYFVGCTFRDCDLHNVDFLGSVFRSCAFEGKVEAIFRKRSPYDEGQSDFNFLSGCDFSRADVSYAQFIQLDLDLRAFGENADIIPLMHGPRDWSEWAEQIDKTEFPGIHLFIEEESKCGTPSIASAKRLRDAGLSEIDIERLRAIGSD